MQKTSMSFIFQWVVPFLLLGLAVLVSWWLPEGNAFGRVRRGDDR